MATVNVDIDSYLDKVTYAANDTIVVRYGAELYIRESNVNQPFQIQSTNSIVRISTNQRKLVFAAGGYIDCVAGDIGKPVVGATTGDSGTLIDYDNATRIWHVLRDDPTDDFFDNASEAVSITGGTGAGTLSALPDQYIILKFNGTNNSGLYFSGGTPQVIIDCPDWYSLGTGDGTDDQTFTFFGAEACPWVQVENDVLDETYTDCRCVYDTAFATYGAGVQLGNVFQHAPDGAIADITFHDGVNGLKPANGANVRCKPLFITSAMAYTATITNRSRLYSPAGLRVDFSGAMFSDRFYVILSQLPYCYLEYVGMFARMTLSETYDVVGNHVIVSKDRAVVNIHSADLGYISGSFTDCQSETYGTTAAGAYGAFYYSYCNGLTFTRCQGVVTARASGSSATLYGLYCYDTITEDCVSIGGYAVESYGGRHKMLNLVCSDTTNGVKSIANGLWLARLNYCSDSEIRGVSLISGGSPAYLGGPGLSSCVNCLVTDIDFDPDSHAANILYVGYGSKDCDIANCHIAGAPRTGNFLIDNTGKRINVRNILAHTTTTGTLDAREMRVEGIVSGATATVSGAYDAPYQLIYDSEAKLTGFVCLVFTSETDLDYFEILAGDPDTSIFFGNNGSLYMQTTGDQCTFEIPYLIQGVSSFQNAEPTILNATWDARSTKEYSIKSGIYGSSWGAWTEVSGANLSAESVDPDVGFYMKFRFTMTDTSESSQLNRFMIPVNTDPAFVFPVGYVPITLSGMITGSKYWIYDDTNSRTLETGTSTGVDVTVYAPCDFDGASHPISVRVRKGDSPPFYDPWEADVTYSDDGTIVAISQIASATQTDTGEAFFSFDSVNKIIEIADTEVEVTVQELVNSIREFETDYIATAQVARTSGKNLVGTGLYSSITLELLDNWRVKFEDRAGPTWTACEVVAGNLIAANIYSNNPIAPGAYISSSRARSTEAALLEADDPIRLEP